MWFVIYFTTIIRQNLGKFRISPTKLDQHNYKKRKNKHKSLVYWKEDQQWAERGEEAVIAAVIVIGKQQAIVPSQSTPLSSCTVHTDRWVVSCVLCVTHPPSRCSLTFTVSPHTSLHNHIWKTFIHRQPTPPFLVVIVPRASHIELLLFCSCEQMIVAW